MSCATLMALGAATPALAATQQAHVHGLVHLDVAIEGPSITIAMNAPLDNFLGFERAPRNDDEKKQVEQMVAQLRAADQLFRIDPVANCKLGPVELNAPVIGVAQAQAGNAPSDGHAEMDATFSFNCIGAPQARFIDVNLFNQFKGARQVDAQIVSPQGQFKRTLKRPAKDGKEPARLTWGS